MFHDTDTRRIVLIHALEDSVAPARAAFAARWPQAQIFDLLDTSLSADLAHAGQLDATMMARFATLADYAASTEGVGGRTAGILFTCSAFAPAIDAVKRRHSIPVLRPNEAAFEAALELGGHIGLVVSFGPSAASLSAELSAMAEARGQRATIEVAVAEGALAALKAGNPDGHDHRVAEAAARLSGKDVIVLGQFSLARAKAAVSARIERPVLTTPASAVDALRARVTCG